MSDALALVPRRLGNFVELQAITVAAEIFRLFELRSKVAKWVSPASRALRNASCLGVPDELFEKSE